MLDSLGVRTATLDAAGHVGRAADLARTSDPVVDPGDVGSVLLLGMGAAGLAADAVAALVGERCCVPVVVCRQHRPPAFVGPRTLVVALSPDGDTTETLDAAIAAAHAGGRMVVLTGGGTLARLAGGWRAPVLQLEPTSSGVASIGAMVVHLLLAFERAGLCDGAGELVGPALDQLATRCAQLAAGGPAERLARRIGRTFPLVYGAGPLGEVAARGWKHQFNEGPKVPAFSNAVPELTHNEVVGWAQHGDVTRQVMTLVVLRHGAEHPEDARRLELVEEVCDEVVADLHEVHAEGSGPLAELLDLLVVGQLTALHMAADAGVDPGPEPVEGEIARRSQRT